MLNSTRSWYLRSGIWRQISRHIAFWRFDQTAVPAMPIVNELGLYPTVTTLRYPKAGEPNSRVKVGVLHLGSKSRTWLDADISADRRLLLPIEIAGRGLCVLCSSQAAQVIEPCFERHHERA